MKIRTDFVTNSSSSSFIRLIVYKNNGVSLSGGYENGDGHVFCSEYFEGENDKFFEQLKDMKSLVNAAQSWYAGGFSKRSDMKESEYGYGNLSVIRKLDLSKVSQVVVQWGVHGDDEWFEHEVKYDFGLKTKTEKQPENQLQNFERQRSLTGNDIHCGWIVFKDKHFVFTGFGFEESNLAEQVKRRGGIYHSSMVNKADYLVIGPDPGQVKIQKALKLQSQGSSVKIVKYALFQAAMSVTPELNDEELQQPELTAEQRAKEAEEAKERESYLRQQAKEQKQLETELRKRKEALEKEAIALEVERLKQEAQELAELRKKQEK